MPAQSLDLEGRVAWVNQSWLRLLGYEEDQCLGKNIEELLAGGSHPTWEVGWLLLQSGESLHGTRLTLVGRNGRRLAVAFDARRVSGEGPHSDHILCVLHPIDKQERAEAILRRIVNGCSAKTGQDYLHALVENLASVLGVRYAYVAERDPDDPESLHTLAAWSDGKPGKNVKISLEQTPSKEVLDGTTRLYGEQLCQVFSDNPELERIHAESYLGAPLLTAIGEPLGVLAVLDDKPFDLEIAELGKSVLEILAARTAAELQRVRMEAALQRSEAKYRELIQEANSIIVRLDAQGCLIYANEYALSFFGYTETELLGRSVVGTIVPPVDSEGNDLSRMIEGILAEPGAYRSNESESLCRDGRRVWISWTNKPLFDGRGELVEILCVGNDVTQLKQSELCIAASEEKFRMMFEAAHDGMVTVEYTDGALKIVDSNRAQRALLGYEHEELVGRSPLDFTAGDSVSQILEIQEIAAKVLAGHPQVFEWPHRRKDGSVFEAEVHVAAFELQGKPMFLAVVRDLTEQRHVEAQQENARLAAEAATRAKSEFLANMSHEIRTPLTAIIGYAELMADTLPEGENATANAAILRNGQHLLEIVNDVLDFSRIEADRLEEEQVDLSPRELLSEVGSLLNPQLASKGLTLTIAPEDSVPETIRTSPLRLRQILVNLVGNAIKFTEDGEIRITARALQDRKELEIEISDTGIGMSEEQMDRLFQPFVQADGSTTRRYGGTGLGLTISHKLARFLGGRLRVESRQGEGSRFTLVLPCTGVPRQNRPLTQRQAESHSQQSLKGHPLAGLRLLLAEDGVDNQKIIAALLQKVGAEVTVVENGREAVMQATQSRFDLILMDMQMPVMDGYEATRHLRQQQYPGAIVALTAHACEGDRQACIEAGCDGYATKPVNLPALVATVLEHGDSARTTSAG